MRKMVFRGKVKISNWDHDQIRLKSIVVADREIRLAQCGSQWMRLSESWIGIMFRFVGSCRFGDGRRHTDTSAGVLCPWLGSQVPPWRGAR